MSIIINIIDQRVKKIAEQYKSEIVLKTNKTEVQEKLQLVGKAIVEDFNYRRVLIGKVAVTEIQNLLNKYG